MDGLLHYINPAHAISILSSLNEERLKGQLCDVLLIVGDHKFRAHKNVLAASSEYFHGLFTDQNNESQTVFQLDFCEADAFDNVLNYIYSSSLFVEKGSLAAVQELGYSLGISFLTSILSKTPQAPFSSPASKKSAFIEDDGSQQRSVIVCQSRNEAQNRDVSNQDKCQTRPSTSIGKVSSGKHLAATIDTLSSFLTSEKKWHSHSVSGEQALSGSLKRKATFHQKVSESHGDHADHGSGSHPRGNEIVKKKLASASLLGTTEPLYSLQKPEKESSEERDVTCYSETGPSSARSTIQKIDRSGPLVKSLLRRSLSMDSQVPAYSEAIEPQPIQGFSSPHERLRGVLDTFGVREKGHDKSVDHLRSMTSQDLHVKTEPSSPVSEPTEVMCITEGDSAQARSQAFPVEDPPITKIPSKRKSHAIKKIPPLRVKLKRSSSPESEYNFGDSSGAFGNFSDSDDSKEMVIATPDVLESKKFKCKHCLKVFRSTAGLHRHINMYHNPDKPYSCDICFKRFHTNFKVWTHCQTQHGVMKNPSPASSTQTVLDERFQRKLIDIVREREIKKALMFKLRRGKSGFSGSSSSQAQALKRSFRSRSKGTLMCNQCGKSFRFLPQFKQHLKVHQGEKMMYSSKSIRPKAPSPPKSPEESKEMFPCRLCNVKFTSFVEQGNHERMCRNATLCPYCSLRFSTPDQKSEHEPKCEYKKLTCLECMRTFKSSFSIWRHQVEVHNQNTMVPTENFSLPHLDHNGEVSNLPRMQPLPDSSKGNSSFLSTKDDGVYSDSSEHMVFDSEDSNCLPEDLSVSKSFSIQVKEEPSDELDDGAEGLYGQKEDVSGSERGVWSCEKCGKIFTVHKQLERHQELLCSVKPFICHVCNKAFRTNFRLWSHFQSHMAQGEDASSFKMPEACPPVSSPSPPPLPPPPPPPPKIEPIEPERHPVFPEKSNSSDKGFGGQESDTLFYHAPPLSAITFKRQFMCKLCHRTFKTAFSLWSHEQTHN